MNLKKRIKMNSWVKFVRSSSIKEKLDRVLQAFKERQDVHDDGRSE